MRWPWFYFGVWFALIAIFLPVWVSPVSRDAFFVAGAILIAVHHREL